MVEQMQEVQHMDEQISLLAEFAAEVQQWHNLLPVWNGVSLIPEEQWTANANFNLWTDASVAGFGAFWDGDYLLGEFTEWTQGQSIAFKELYAIVAALATWGPSWGGKKIRIYCDNSSICQILPIAAQKVPRLLPFCTLSTACPLSLAVSYLRHICWVQIIHGRTVFRGAGWRSFMRSVPKLPLCPLILAILCSILVMKQICELNTHIATWPHLSLTSSTRRTYTIGCRT